MESLVWGKRNILVTLGQELGKARLEIGLTQALAAQKAKVGSSHISKIERDLEIPSEDLIVNLGRIYDKNPTVWIIMSGRIPRQYMVEFMQRPELSEEFLRTWKDWLKA